MSNLIYKQAEISDIDNKLGIVKGYGSVFGNVDSDNDIVQRGAYSRTIKNNGSRVKYLYQHDITKPIGKIKELEEDEYGLKFVAEIPKTTFGTEVLELLKYGVIEENSVGMQVLDRENREDGVRVITEAKLYEISAVTLAANDQAKILDVKSKHDKLDFINKKFNRLNEFIKNADGVTDELAYAVEYELEVLKSLTQIARSNVHQSEPIAREESHLEAKEDKTTSDSIFNYLFNNLKV